MKGKTAIAGLGITNQGKVYDYNHVGFAIEAVRLALDDAGLKRDDLDGLLLNPGLSWTDQGMGSFQLQQAMGLRDLRLSATMHLGGATASAMIQHAAQAIAAGLCTTVACVFSDAPLKPPAPMGEKVSSGAAYAFARGWEQAYGYYGVNAMYALVARRHMHLYGTTQDHLGRSVEVHVAPRDERVHRVHPVIAVGLFPAARERVGGARRDLLAHRRGRLQRRVREDARDGRTQARRDRLGRVLDHRRRRGP